MELLHAQPREVLANSMDDPWRDYSVPHAVLSTWQLSVDYIAQNNMPALQLLYVMALLARESIPTEVLLSFFESDRLALDKALSALLSLHLVNAVTELPFFNMHRLVQLCVRMRLQDEGSDERWTLESLNMKLSLRLLQNCCITLRAYHLAHKSAETALQLSERATECVSTDISLDLFTRIGLQHSNILVGLQRRELASSFIEGFLKGLRNDQRLEIPQKEIVTFLISSCLMTMQPDADKAGLVDRSRDDQHMSNS